jgi:hypothetical protein
LARARGQEDGMADDDNDIVEHLTPKAAMTALTRVAVKSERLQHDLDLVRLAFLGAIHEAIECDMEADALPHIFKRMLDKLELMYSEAHDIAKLLRDAGVGLYPLVEDEPEGDAA